MPQVDFYVLKGTDAQARMQFAARLCEKAVNTGMKVHVLTNNGIESDEISKVFWSFRPDAFLPNSVTPAPNTPVLIHEQPPQDLTANTLLINLSSKVPMGLERYQRLAEIVIQEPDVLKTTRQNYMSYKNKGLGAKTHSIS